MSTPERFWTQVEFTDTCWLWAGSTWTDGYPSFSLGGKRRLAHRWAYEFCVGPIPEGLTLDHLCRVRHCVRPEHLEPVTQRINTLRSPLCPSAINARKTHCIRGHEFTEANTYRYQNRPSRGCRECSRIRQRKVRVEDSWATG